MDVFPVAPSKKGAPAALTKPAMGKDKGKNTTDPCPKYDKESGAPQRRFSLLKKGSGSKVPWHAACVYLFPSWHVGGQRTHDANGRPDQDTASSISAGAPHPTAMGNSFLFLWPSNARPYPKALLRSPSSTDCHARRCTSTRIQHLGSNSR